MPTRGELPVARSPYEPRRKQSRFDGSFRQRRAGTLRLVASEARRVADLDSDAVAALERDGLVSVAAGLVSLPVESATRPET